MGMNYAPGREQDAAADEEPQGSSQPVRTAPNAPDDAVRTGPAQNASGEAGSEGKPGHPGEKAAKSAVNDRPTPKADMRKVSLSLPDYAYEALCLRALKNRTTLQYEIFKALRGNGIQIREADMIPDGRRHNAKRRK